MDIENKSILQGEGGASRFDDHYRLNLEWLSQAHIMHEAWLLLRPEQLPRFKIRNVRSTPKVTHFGTSHSPRRCFREQGRRVEGDKCLF